MHGILFPVQIFSINNLVVHVDVDTKLLPTKVYELSCLLYKKLKYKNYFLNYKHICMCLCGYIYISFFYLDLWGLNDSSCLYPMPKVYGCKAFYNWLPFSFNFPSSLSPLTPKSYGKPKSSELLLGSIYLFILHLGFMFHIKMFLFQLYIYLTLLLTLCWIIEYVTTFLILNN